MAWIRDECSCSRPAEGRGEDTVVDDDPVVPLPKLDAGVEEGDGGEVDIGVDDIEITHYEHLRVFYSDLSLSSLDDRSEVVVSIEVGVLDEPAGVREVVF